MLECLVFYMVPNAARLSKVGPQRRSLTEFPHEKHNGTWLLHACTPQLGFNRPAALSDEFKNALEDREKINKNVLLFDIVTGDDNKIVGEDVTKFEDQLKQENVQHVYTLLPGGTHSMFVWRPALSNFLQEIFKH
jgi:dienelactone hydrolase